MTKKVAFAAARQQLLLWLHLSAADDDRYDLLAEVYFLRRLCLDADGLDAYAAGHKAGERVERAIWRERVEGLLARMQKSGISGYSTSAMELWLRVSPLATPPPTEEEQR